MSDVEKKRILERLETDSGYLLVNVILQEQVDALQQEILFTRCTSMDMVVQMEYKKGQLEGRLAVENLRKTMVDNLSIDIERERNGNREPSNDTGTTDIDASDTRLAP